MHGFKTPVLKPFFSYFGSKWLLAPHYPRPQHDRIIEPFAGSACFSLHYSDRKVILYEIYPVVAGVWDYLIRAGESEILALPSEIVSLEDHPRLPQEARWLIGFWLSRSVTSPRPNASKWMRQKIRPNLFWGKVARRQIASQLKYVRHWKIVNKSYEEAPDRKAYWFVDPPYQAQCGGNYKHRKIDFSVLADWCRDRRGQVVVCEQEGADWLPFDFVKEIKTARLGKTSREVMWTKGTTPIRQGLGLV